MQNGKRFKRKYFLSSPLFPPPQFPGRYHDLPDFDGALTNNIRTPISGKQKYLRVFSLKWLITVSIYTVMKNTVLYWNLRPNRFLKQTSETVKFFALTFRSQENKAKRPSCFVAQRCFLKEWRKTMKEKPFSGLVGRYTKLEMLFSWRRTRLRLFWTCQSTPCWLDLQTVLCETV